MTLNNFYVAGKILNLQNVIKIFMAKLLKTASRLVQFMTYIITLIYKNNRTVKKYQVQYNIRLSTYYIFRY